MNILKTYTTAAAFIGAVAAALATAPGSETVRGTMAVAYGDDPNVTGSCNLGSMPSGCTSVATAFGICTVTFTSGATADARTPGCSGFYYRTTATRK